MTNHVHLLVTPVESDAASRMMKRLGELYVPKFNARRGRTGTLWEGRYKAAAVSTGGYFLQCQRYIELNPVRAAMVKHPVEYPWSSYRVNAGIETSLFVVRHTEYLSLAPTEEERHAAYAASFGTAFGADDLEAIRNSVNSGVPFGDFRFIAQLEARSGRSLAPNKGGRPYKEKPGSGPGFVTSAGARLPRAPR